MGKIITDLSEATEQNPVEAQLNAIQEAGYIWMENGIVFYDEVEPDYPLINFPSLARTLKGLNMDWDKAKAEYLAEAQRAQIQAWTSEEMSGRSFLDMCTAEERATIERCQRENTPIPQSLYAGIEKRIRAR